MTIDSLLANFWLADPQQPPRGPAGPVFEGLFRRGFPCGIGVYTSNDLTGCEGRVVCWKPLPLVERPAQTAKTHNPTPIHLSCGLL